MSNFANKLTAGFAAVILTLVTMNAIIVVPGTSSMVVAGAPLLA